MKRRRIRTGRERTISVFRRFGFGLGFYFCSPIGGKYPRPWLVTVDLGWWQLNINGPGGIG